MDDPITEALKAARARLPARTELSSSAPAPRLNGVIKERGPYAVRDALKAWDKRINGESILDVAHEFGLSIEAAKQLIKEAHAAIAEDLKENLNLNRALDLYRIDELIKSFYEQAKAGDERAASFVLKCLERRSKLCGTEPEQAPGRSHPENVLIWIQNQLPSINRIVESLPAELPQSP